MGVVFISLHVLEVKCVMISFLSRERYNSFIYNRIKLSSDYSRHFSAIFWCSSCVLFSIEYELHLLDIYISQSRLIFRWLLYCIDCLYSIIFFFCLVCFMCICKVDKVTNTMSISVGVRMSTVAKLRYMCVTSILFFFSPNIYSVLY